MKASVRVMGGSEFDRKLARLAEEMRRSIPSLVKQHARSGAVNLGFYTLPYGFDEPEKFRERIEADVRRVFATRDDPSAVYLLIRQVDPKKAELYWAAHKKGSKRRALDILNSVSVRRGVDVDVLRDARRGRGASVPKRIQPRALATKSELNAMARRQAKLAGFAKAAWYQAGRAIGGRIRTNIVREDGSRGTKETFPAFIRKLANANAGIGGARQGGGESHYWVEIFSNVRHAENALSKGAKARALDAAREGFGKACREALAEMRGRIFKKAG